MATERDKTTPAPTGTHSEPAPASPRAEIDAFIKRARTLAPSVEPGKRGRLIFARNVSIRKRAHVA